MTSRKVLVVLLVALVVTACGGGDEIASGAQSLIALVKHEIADNTSESATPIVINDLPISDQGTDDTSLPDPV